MLFGWPLAVFDAATLSGGAWETALPLANVRSGTLARVARSVDAGNASTVVNVDFGAASAVSILALCRHNLRSAAEFRLRGSASSDMSAPVYDSGTLDVWGPQWSVGVLPAGHPNAATRLLTDAQIDALDPPRDLVHTFAEASARYWRLELFDDTNADDFVEIGRMVLAPRYEPRYNFAVGSEFGFIDETTVSKSLDGVRFYDVKPKGRSFGGSFTNLPDAEALTVLRDMLEQLGQAGQVYFVQDPGDALGLQRGSFLATFRQLGAVQRAAAGFSNVPFVLDEVL